MSKTLWHTIKLEVPKEMINITKNDKVVVKKALTKTNNISKSNNEPSIKIIPGNTNKPKIINDGKEWNIEELKLKMTKAKELGKKNEGKELKKKINIDEKFRKFKDENIAFTNGQAINPKEILFDKKKNFSEKLFMGTYPQYHFKDNLETIEQLISILDRRKDNLFKILETFKNIEIKNSDENKLKVKNFLNSYNTEFEVIDKELILTEKLKLQ